MTYEYPINVFMEEKIKLRKEESIRIGLGTACFFFSIHPLNTTFDFFTLLKMKRKRAQNAANV